MLEVLVSLPEYSITDIFSHFYKDEVDHERIPAMFFEGFVGSPVLRELPCSYCWRLA